MLVSMLPGLLTRVLLRQVNSVPPTLSEIISSGRDMVAWRPAPSGGNAEGDWASEVAPPPQPPAVRRMRRGLPACSPHPTAHSTPCLELCHLRPRVTYYRVTHDCYIMRHISFSSPPGGLRPFWRSTCLSCPSADVYDWMKRPRSCGRTQQAATARAGTRVGWRQRCHGAGRGGAGRGGAGCHTSCPLPEWAPGRWAPAAALLFTGMASQAVTHSTHPHTRAGQRALTGIELKPRSCTRWLRIVAR